ncbi:MAG: hypothetical protein ACOVS5_00420 [Oligoflexus sp.]
MNLEKGDYLNYMTHRGPGRTMDFTQHMTAADAQLALETKEL